MNAAPRHMVTIHLALSERAATELKGYIDRGGFPEDAAAGHPVVIDQILEELTSQLTNAAPRGDRKPVPVQTSTPVAQAVAEAMATAGAQALNQKAP